MTSRFIIHERPDEAIEQRLKELKKLRQSNKTTYKAVVRKLIQNDLWFVVRAVLQCGTIDDQLIGYELGSHINNNWGQDQLIVMPRGYGKTVTLAAITIASICSNPKIRIIMAHAVEDFANKFGSYVADTLMNNAILQDAFGSKYNNDGFLPAKTADAKRWSMKSGYQLDTNTTIDPTLFCLGINSNIPGKHPDFMILDDLTDRTTNTPEHHQQQKDFIQSSKNLLPSTGFFLWTGTRYHNNDPISDALAGKLIGKTGRFCSIVRSCYVDDNPDKGSIFPFKKRWQSAEPSGYTVEMLLKASEGEAREDFNAQMRNNPTPEDTSEIRLDRINYYTVNSELPEHGPVISFGMEALGGGKIAYEQFLTYCRERQLQIPVQAITLKRDSRISKWDRIRAVLTPIINDGRLWLPKWASGDHDGSLYHEIKAGQYSKHDDIIDALHNCIKLMGSAVPRVGEPAHCYVAVDVAWTVESHSDYSVAIACIIDKNRNIYVLDYHRFKMPLDTQLYITLEAFWRKISNSSPIVLFNNNKKYRHLIKY